VRRTGAATEVSSSANTPTSAAGGVAKAIARALAERTLTGTDPRRRLSSPIVSLSASTRPRPTRSTSCRHADCAPNGVDMSDPRTVSRLSSKRKAGGALVEAARMSRVVRIS
jgi:hypothetical protein